MTDKAVLQKLFDTSLNHIRKQGRPSANNGTCSYRSLDGYSCAAAPFIREYSRRMENKSWAILCDKFHHCLDPVALENGDFVQDLQRAHDGAYNKYEVFRGGDDPEKYMVHFMSEYERNMRDIASVHGLVYQEPSE